MPTERDLYLPVAAQPSVDTLVDYARTAERLGYDRVWLPETWGRDAVTTLTTIAERTERVGIGTSIMPVYSRSPALIGQTAATLQEVCGGRLRLGLGPSGPLVVEGWHGVDFERPLRYTRETLDVVRAVLAGERVDYDGDFFDLSGFRLRCEPPDPTPPLDAGGMGPKSVELAGRFADGWHALMMTPDGMADRLGDFQRGGDLGDRDRDDQRVTLSVACMVDPDAPDRARDLARQHLAFYVGGMGTYYRDSLARQGWEDEAHEIAQLWANREKQAATEAVPDDLLADLAAVGTPAQARKRLEDFASLDGVDAVSVSFPRAADPEDVERTAEVLAPSE